LIDLANEYQKTQFELKDYQEAIRYGKNYKSSNAGDMDRMELRLDDKLKAIEKHFRDAGIANPQQMEEALKKNRYSMDEKRRLRGNMYSYDVKESDFFAGCSEVDVYLRLSKQRSREGARQ